MQFNTVAIFTALISIAEALPAVTDDCNQFSVPTVSVISKVAEHSNRHSNHENQIPTTLITKTTGTLVTPVESTPAEITTDVPTSAENETTSSAASASTSPTGAVHTGIATFYSVGADNCGTSSTDSDFVCAISKQLYNTLDNSEDISGYCGRTISITYQSTTIQVKVVDSCESCDDNHLDLSPAAFQALANPDLGVLDITWVWD